MGTPSGKLVLELTRVFPRPRPIVWEAFTDPKQLVKWWGPEGFSVPSVAFDPRVGASYRIEMKPPETEPFYLGGDFQVVEPPERLAYSFAWEDPDPDDIKNLVELAFQDLGGSTAVLLNHGPFKTEARRELLHNGWTESFDKLQQMLSQQ